MSASCPHEIAISSDTEKIILICVSAISGSLSIIGSSLIIYILSHGGWRKLARLRNRLVLGMSIIDIFSSAVVGLSIILTPQETECSIGMGNQLTCTVQGFFIQLGFAVPGYNAMLSFYFLMTIRNGMDQAIVAEKYELFMHAFVLIPTLTTAIIGAAGGMYFSESSNCWFGDICQSLGNCPNGNILGNGFWVMIVSVLFVFAYTSIVVICLITIYWTLRKRILATQRHAFQPGREIENRRQTEIEFAENEIAKQAMFYVIAYFATYLFPSVAIVRSFSGEIVLPYWHHLLSAALFPLHGFWNFVGYTRPIVSKIHRESSGDTSSIAAIKLIILDGFDDSAAPRVRRRSSIYGIPISIPMNDDEAAELESPSV